MSLHIDRHGELRAATARPLPRRKFFANEYSFSKAEAQNQPQCFRLSPVKTGQRLSNATRSRRNPSGPDAQGADVTIANHRSQSNSLYNSIERSIHL